MKTKAALLTISFSGLGIASSMAQINAVGYLNLICLPGFNIIACQLQTTNNSIGSLLNNRAGGWAGAFDGIQIYKWNGTGFDVDTADSNSGTPTGWDKNGVLTLNPGEAAWLNNTHSTNIVFTFVGTIPQGWLTNTIPGPGKFSMLSSIVPQAGDLATNLGLTNFNDGDQVYMFNLTNQSYTVYTVDKLLGNSGYSQQFMNIGDPRVNVSQGFWYRTSDSGASITWVRYFALNGAPASSLERPLDLNALDLRSFSGGQAQPLLHTDHPGAGFARFPLRSQIRD